MQLIAKQSMSTFFSSRNLQSNDSSLLLACSTSGEDPVELIKAAGSRRIPLDPSLKDPRFAKEVIMPIPSSIERPSINDVLTELQAQDWYHDQMSYRRSFPAKEGEMCTFSP